MGIKASKGSKKSDTLTTLKLVKAIKSASGVKGIPTTVLKGHRLNRVTSKWITRADILDCIHRMASKYKWDTVLEVSDRIFMLATNTQGITIEILDKLRGIYPPALDETTMYITICEIGKPPKGYTCDEQLWWSSTATLQEKIETVAPKFSKKILKGTIEKVAPSTKRDRPSTLIQDEEEIIDIYNWAKSKDIKNKVDLYATLLHPFTTHLIASGCSTNLSSKDVDVIIDVTKTHLAKTTRLDPSTVWLLGYFNEYISKDEYNGGSFEYITNVAPTGGVIVGRGAYKKRGRLKLTPIGDKGIYVESANDNRVVIPVYTPEGRKCIDKLHEIQQIYKSYHISLLGELLTTKNIDWDFYYYQDQW